MRAINRSALVLSALLTAGPAMAASDASVEGSIEAYRVRTTADGYERFVAVEDAAPRDVIEYRVRYENVGDSRVDGLDVVGPVPPNTRYVGGSAATGVAHSMQVSIDGGATWESEPVRRPRVGADGVERLVVVGPGEYTHVRWSSADPLPAGSARLFIYRVRVD